MSEGDRIRWHCRRGMLELDLVLQRFVERHLTSLSAEKRVTFGALLARTDPELLDLVMGRIDPTAPDERALVELLRAA